MCLKSAQDKTVTTSNPSAIQPIRKSHVRIIRLDLTEKSSGKYTHGWPTSRGFCQPYRQFLLQAQHTSLLSFPYLTLQMNVIKYTIFLQWATQTKYAQLINVAVISLIFQWKQNLKVILFQPRSLELKSLGSHPGLWIQESLGWCH